MTEQTFAIVVTTIRDGSFLDEYVAHFVEEGCLDQVSMYVVGDLTTPLECRQRVEQYRAQGLTKWHYLGEAEQDSFLQPFPKLASEIPWHSDNRRNVGFLMAYHDGCDVIIAIDDDNYPRAESPFLGADGHSTVGAELDLGRAVGHAGWFNACALMDVDCTSMINGDTVYARGFPYERRDVRCGAVDDETTRGRVGINAGLWSGDPDVDAATRLVTRCRVAERLPPSYLLAPDVLTPINTQNTALIRDALPTYYYVKMGHPVAGMKLDRFGDIFSGFFVQKCARAVGDRVHVGGPVVEHRRSPHNLFEDLWHELPGIALLDDMVTLLEAPLPHVDTYSEAALLMADGIREWAERGKGFLWEPETKAYFHNVADNMCTWVDVTAALAT